MNYHKKKINKSTGEGKQAALKVIALHKQTAQLI